MLHVSHRMNGLNWKGACCKRAKRSVHVTGRLDLLLRKANGRPARWAIPSPEFVFCLRAVSGRQSIEAGGIIRSDPLGRIFGRHARSMLNEVQSDLCSKTRSYDFVLAVVSYYSDYFVSFQGLASSLGFRHRTNTQYLLGFSKSEKLWSVP